MLASIANNKDYNEAESDDLFNQALIDVVTPFASPSMIAQEFLEVYEGRKKLDDTTVAGSVLRGVLKSFEPGTITLLEKILLDFLIFRICLPVLRPTPCDKFTFCLLNPINAGISTSPGAIEKPY